MSKYSLPRLARFLCLCATVYLVSCQGVLPPVPAPAPQKKTTGLGGVLMWKGDSSESGNYSSETTLTPSNVNPEQFGRIDTFQADGIIMAQPLYVSSLDMGSAGTHDVIIVATEHDSVYAVDAENPDAGSLWERHYVDPANGITTMPDNFGGRTTVGGEIGITGTPYIDATTGAMYFVTVLEDNGTPQQWLRAIDIRTGNDYGPGSVQITASVPGDGKASVNGQIAFDPSIHNNRMGLTEVNGAIIIGWSSFSDYGVYHGWLMAYDPSTLKQLAAFNPTTQAQPIDAANGIADHGGGGGMWQGGAPPAVDADGNIFVNTADGSFNADQGGNNYGDTMLKLQFNGSSFQIVDWFTPYNAACIDKDDIELGSGGVALLPTDFTNGVKLAIAHDKEGRMFLVNTDTMGHFNTSADQIPQEFMVGQYTCSDTTQQSAADGPNWNRLYGTPSYWNGYIYSGASNLPLKQYKFENGLLDPTPTATSPSSFGYRGANTVVSSNGTQNGIVWASEKTPAGLGILHAYDANDISHELWNSNMVSQRDAIGEGIGFGVPVIANGQVIVANNKQINIFGLVQ